MATTPSALESKFGSCCARRAIPLRPEGRSFSRKSGDVSPFDRLCRHNLETAVASMLSAGLTAHSIEQIINRSPADVSVSIVWIRRYRTRMVENGEIPSSVRRALRQPRKILSTHASIRLYTLAVNVYLSLSDTKDYVEPSALMRTVQLVAALSPDCEVDINDGYSVLAALLAGDVCMRHCDSCENWSLLAIDALQPMRLCPFCKHDISTADVWYAD